MYFAIKGVRIKMSFVSDEEALRIQKAVDSQKLHEASSEPKSQAQKAADRNDILITMSMGTSEQKRAAKEAMERQKAESQAAKEEEAAKRKQNSDSRKMTKEEMQQKAVEDAQAMINKGTDGVLGGLESTIGEILSQKDSTINEAVTTFGKAKKEVEKIIKTSKEVQEFLKDPKKGLQELAVKTLSNEKYLSILTDVFSGKVTEASVLDAIGGNIASKIGDIKNMAQNITEQFLLKKAYISAYIKETFGNAEYMKNLVQDMSKKIGEKIQNLAYEKLGSFADKGTQKLDGVFSTVGSKVDQITSKVLTKIDTLTKIISLENITKKLEGVLSLDSLKSKLEGTAFGKILSNPIMNLATNLKDKFMKTLNLSKYTQVLSKVTAAIQKIQGAITKAKEFIQNKIQMIKEYVTALKDQAINMVKEYASKIVSDIASKISISGTIGGCFG